MPGERSRFATHGWISVNELGSVISAFVFSGLFVASKVVSTCVYQFTWRNAVNRDLRSHGPLVLLASRWWLWPVHVTVVAVSARVSWTEIPQLHHITIVLMVLLTLGAVFRFGAADLRRFFVVDRILASGLCAGVCFCPAFLYPALVVCCCVQYAVSRWRLGPGYSNLLGFEFIRGSVCAVLTCIVCAGCWSWLPASPPETIGYLFVVVLIAVQASSYVNHALAKAALGPRWYSWFCNNRIECLVVNSYLRGWASRLGKDNVLALAGLVKRYRIAVCAGAFFLELGFACVLLDRYVASALFLTAAGFHLTVLVLTGLAEVEFVINHVALSWWMLVSASLPDELFGIAMMAVCVLNMAIAWAWVGWTRLKMLREFQHGGRSRQMGMSDAFDHLMAWWDSPYMRMYSYVVVTANGQRKPLAVPKLSPYDTSLTDIHTHMMILNMHADLDPMAEADKRRWRTGVWGLVITTKERDELYMLMDNPERDLSMLSPAESLPPWVCSPHEDAHAVAKPLQELFSGINTFRRHAWFRIAMRYPHFPGEDLAPDVCPLVDNADERYDLSMQIQAVVIQRIKTFYTGTDIRLVEQSDVGIIHLDGHSTPSDESGRSCEFV